MIPSGLYAYTDGTPKLLTPGETAYAGNWQPRTKYQARLKQVVSFNNRYYFCIADTSGVLPNAAQTPAVWAELVLANSVSVLGGDSAGAITAAAAAQTTANSAVTTANSAVVTANDAQTAALLALSGTGVVQIQAAENVPAFYPITINGFKVNPSNSAHYGHLAGLTAIAVTPGFMVSIQRGGIMSNPLWSWTPQSFIFIASGGLSQTPPTSGWTQIIGIAQNDTDILLTLGEPVLL